MFVSFLLLIIEEFLMNDRENDSYCAVFFGETILQPRTETGLKEYFLKSFAAPPAAPDIGRPPGGAIRSPLTAISAT